MCTLRPRTRPGSCCRPYTNSWPGCWPASWRFSPSSSTCTCFWSTRGSTGRAPSTDWTRPTSSSRPSPWPASPCRFSHTYGRRWMWSTPCATSAWQGQSCWCSSSASSSSSSGARRSWPSTTALNWWWSPCTSTRASRRPSSNTSTRPWRWSSC